jgi:hypothetical protein
MRFNMTDKITLRERALGFDAKVVATMKGKITASFKRRDQFESDNGLNVGERNSYTVERDRMLKNSTAVAMLFLALDLQPSEVIERKVACNAMFNAKALKKVNEIASFVCGYGEKLERVMRAFIACAIVATDKGVDVITNAVNARFLNSDDLKAHITDSDLLENLDDLRAKHMTSGAATQSSQCRNVLDVLGLGSVRSIDKPRDSIALNADHAFYSLFRERFMVTA